MHFKPKLNETFSIETVLKLGEENCIGMLSSKKGRLWFKTNLHYQQFDLAMLFQQMTTTDGEAYIPHAIGRIGDGVCSFLSMRLVDRPGFLDANSGEDLSAKRYRVGAAIFGLEVEGAKADVLDLCEFRFTDIAIRLAHRPEYQVTQERRAVTFPGQIQTLLSFSSLALHATIEICSHVDATFTAGKGTRIIPDVKVRVTLIRPRSLEWVVSLSERMENFFSLFMGTSVATRHVIVGRQQKEGYVVLHEHARREAPNQQLWLQCADHVVAAALARFLSASEESRALEKTILGMLRKSSLFSETEFLSLAQGFEAFSRTRSLGQIVSKQEFKKFKDGVKTALIGIDCADKLTARAMELLNHANERSFYEQLLTCFSSIPSASFEKLFGEAEQVARTLVRTRNFFTHLGSVQKEGVVTGDDLFLFNKRLRALLRGLMLLDLGFDFGEIREGVSYEAQRWSLL